MALILSLETSAEVCSVALHADGILKDASEIHIKQSHASRLAPMIDGLLTLTKTDRSAIDALAVSAGPGSFTGLRIGVATAKGLCYGLDKPLIALSTLDIMAAGIPTLDDSRGFCFCPMIDARRDEVYCALLSEVLEPLSAPAPLIVTAESLSQLIGGRRVLCFGSGADKCTELIEAAGGIFIPNIYPTAGFMGKLAHNAFLNNKFEEVVSFEPYYLKAFQGRKQ